MSTGVLVALVSKFLFRAYKAVLEGRNIPDCFAESRTVFIPKTSDTDDLGRIIRSLDALRPVDIVQLRLQTPYLCYLSRPSLVHYAMHPPLTEMHLLQADDRQHF